jgi:hypothetical protein
LNLSQFFLCGSHELKPLEDSTRDKLAINVTITNLSARPVGWDSEFSVFLSWTLGSEGDSTGSAREQTSSHIKQTESSLSKTRFILIEPGDSIAKTVILNVPFRTFACDEDGKGYEVWTRYFLSEYERDQARRSAEDLYWRFHGKGSPQWEHNSNFGKGLHKIQVRLGYYGSPDLRNPDAFKNLFGFEPKEVSLWDDDCDSNVLQIDLDG